MRLSGRRTAIAASAMLVLICLALPAQAVLVSSIDGTFSSLSSVTVTPGGPPGAVGNVLSEVFRGPRTLFDGAPIPGGDVPTLIISTQTITSVAVDGTVTTYTLSTDPLDTSFKELLFNGAQGGGAVLFDPVFSEALVDSVSPDTLLLRGMETVSFDSNPTFDFSPLEGGVITVTVNAPGTDFNTVLSADSFGSVSVVGTFSQFTVASPEPSTFVLAALSLLSLGMTRRRRRR